MAQHDQVLANGSGAAFRGDANDALAALFSLSSGATAPSVTVAYQWWADTANGILKQRNAANTGWVSRCDLTTAFLQEGSLPTIRAIPQNSKSADYTLVLEDSGHHIFHPAADTNDRTFTIPANSSVAFEIGAAVTFINLSLNDLSIAIASDTLRLVGSGSTGTRTLGQYGLATAVKVASTVWVISGVGLA